MSSPKPDPASACPTRGLVLLLVISLGALLGLAMHLVPLGSFPVGDDVFRSLLIARTWAEHGFPDALPPAAFTGLDHRFADQQLAFDGLLALCGGRSTGPGLVPPVMWALFVLQGAVFWLSLRLLRRDETPAWILLLPAVSQTWLFRCTTLRAMSLAMLFLLPLVAVTAARARGSRVKPFWLLLCTAGFAYSHGAVELPPLLWLLGAAGTRLERGRGSFPWRDGLWVLGGLLVASVLRPDFPANLRLWTVLNAGLIYATGLREVRVYPTELRPLRLEDLIAIEWTFLLAAALLIGMNARPKAERRWSLLLPACLLILAAVSSRRLLEVASPIVLLALAASRPWRLRLWLAAALSVTACLMHVPNAAAGAEANRLRELQPVAAWLRERGKRDDLVFVTDWATSSPLAFFTYGTGLRFSGAIDPVYMWAASPDLWRDWQLLKEGQFADPIQVMRKRFGARFLVFNIADAPAGLPPGTTANQIRRAMSPAMSAGDIVDVFAVYPDDPANPRNWIALEFAPP